MATNPYVNKVVYGGNTVMDISDTTAVASDVAQGKYFYTASGAKVAGTATGGGGSAVTVTEEQLPGGGIAKHITAVDISSDTVDAAHLAQGYTAHSADGTAITGTMSGGGGGSATAKALNFYDSDGNIVNSYSRTEALALTALPSNPTKTGLTAQGWNWSLANIKSYLTKYPDAVVNVGQMYITDDGKTRLYCHFEDERCSPYLQLYPNGTVVIDWGDNSATDTLTGTSLTSIKNVQHEYASGGDYVITLTVTGTARIQGSSSTNGGSYLLQKASGTSSTYESLVYRNAVRKIEIGSGIDIYNYAFKSMYSLESVTIPRSVTSIGSYAFQNCYSLTNINLPEGVTSIRTCMFQNCYALISINIPNNVTSIETYAFSNCYSLTSINIPDGVTSIGAYAFQSCRALTSINIPDGVTSIGTYAFSGCYSFTTINIPDGVTSIETYAFSNCYSLTSINIPDGATSIGQSAFSNCYSIASLTIPEDVTNIAASAFGGCYGMKEYHFLSTTPPTLANTNAFTNIQSDCIIYVPVGSLEDYASATNWSQYSSYMREEGT